MVNLEDYFLRLQKAAAKDQESAADGHEADQHPKKKPRRDDGADNYPVNPS